MEAANSIACSEALSASNGQAQIELITPVILRSLYTESQEKLSLLNSKILGKHKGESAEQNEVQANSTTESIDRDLLALQGLRTLFDTVNASQVQLSTISIVNFILKSSKNDAWNTTLIELMAEWTPVQYRFIILRTLLEILISVSLQNFGQQLTIAKLISSLLSCSVNLVGLSVLDVLQLLFSQLIGVLQAPKRREGEVSEVRATLVKQLTLSMGDLATHIYYSDQIMDMITEVISRLEPYLPAKFHEYKSIIKGNMASFLLWTQQTIWKTIRKVEI